MMLEEIKSESQDSILVWELDLEDPCANPYEASWVTSKSPSLSLSTLLHSVMNTKGGMYIMLNSLVEGGIKCEKLF